MRENKEFIVVSGVVAKKPRKAIDEWIHTTRQRDILSVVSEYDYLKRNRHLRKLWYDLPDAEKAPYIEIYRKNYENYKMLISKAVNSEDNGGNSPEEPPKKIRGKEKGRLLFLVL